ncbi:hypothetical protein [Nonomuraea gerenzanensis]|uniref:hypothetical protein n=1 Tax=Nonomuraea gerenzanensis TaxID=93944 RepID=UPI001CD9EF09|nr:hypothetical protein [Nonomuraea gerenzanensis]UBU12931.1 hypothetical protein LCN96_53270 [Nonomuraea gerenzanensis]
MSEEPGNWTFIVDWSDPYDDMNPVVIYVSGDSETQARRAANRQGTDHFANIGVTDLLGSDGYVVAVFRGDVRPLLVGAYSIL